MEFFLKDQRLKIALHILVMVLSLIVIAKKDAVHYQTSVFENLMIDAFAPMQRSIFYVKERVSSFFQHYITNVDASKENILLGEKIKHLENRLFIYDEIERENNRIKDLLQFGEEIKSDKVLAQIVAWDASSDFKVLRVNKGSKDGIKILSPVVTANGLVGYVFKLTDHFSEIISILDSNNRVDAIIQRTRSHGIVEGFAKGRCAMKYVTRTEPIILNDLVITSGLGNIFPKGLKVGAVTKIEKESYGITQHVEITPSVDFDRLEEVIILVSDFIQVTTGEWLKLDASYENEEEDENFANKVDNKLSDKNKGELDKKKKEEKR